MNCEDYMSAQKSTVYRKALYKLKAHMLLECVLECTHIYMHYSFMQYVYAYLLCTIFGRNM